MESAKIFTLLYFALILLFTIIFVGSILDQGRKDYCLLGLKIENDLLVPNENPCKATSVSAGVSGVTCIVLGGVEFFMESTSFMTLVLSCIATGVFIIMIVCSGLISAGLSQTCQSFGNNCGAAFTNASKNYTTVNAGVWCAWIATVLWVGYTGVKWYQYRSFRASPETHELPTRKV